MSTVIKKGDHVPVHGQQQRRAGSSESTRDRNVRYKNRIDRRDAQDARDELYEDYAKALAELQNRVSELRSAYENSPKSNQNSARNSSLTFLEIINDRVVRDDTFESKKGKTEVSKDALEAVVKAFMQLTGAVLLVHEGIEHNYKSGVTGLAASFGGPLVSFFVSTKPQGGGMLVGNGSTLYKLINQNIFSLPKVQECFGELTKSRDALQAVSELITEIGNELATARQEDNLADKETELGLTVTDVESLERKKSRQLQEIETEISRQEECGLRK